jgi:glycosyltransferase involved in cell wall biosynthesis
MPARAALKWLGKNSWRGVVLTPGAKQQFEGIIASERLRVLPNTVPDPGVTSRRASDGRFRVVYLSNLVRGKGYLDLLVAADLLVDEIPELEVVLAGAWYDGREEAERLLASPRLSNHVRLAGVVSGAAKDALLRSADVFVFPPYQIEGQPLVLLEAMAAGLPIVTTNSGLIPETVEANRNALMVPPSTPTAIADAIRTLWRQETRRAELARASRSLYDERYTPAKFRENVRSLFSELSAE